MATRRTTVRRVTGLLVTTTVMLAGLLGLPAGPAQAHRVPVESAPRSVYTPVTRLLHNDPLHAPHAISDALVRTIDAVPSGERIDVATYFISSRRVARALERAARRGVRVKVILAGNAKSRSFATARRLARVLDAHHGSFALWSAGAARAHGGILHQKTWRFSRVGDARWVVVNGSYNAGTTSDLKAYALAWQVVGDRGLYDAFDAVFRAQRAQRPLHRPLRLSAGAGWTAYFLPVGAQSPATDPVMTRLRAITADRRTTIRIQMYSMWGPRAEWIAAELARMARHGARVTLLAGPTVDPIVQGILRRGGVTVRSACFADQTYTHAKDMAASWVDAGGRHWWTWVGSDNWTSAGMDDDEAVLGVSGKAGYREFAKVFATVAGRGDAVPTTACRPVLD